MPKNINNVNAINEQGETLLHLAVQQNDFDAVRALIGQGADVNIADNQGRSPLYMAIAHKVSDIHRPSYSIIDILLEKKANVFHPTTEGKTPLFLANELSKTKHTYNSPLRSYQEDDYVSNQFEKLRLHALDGANQTVESVSAAMAEFESADEDSRDPALKNCFVAYQIFIINMNVLRSLLNNQHSGYLEKDKLLCGQLEQQCCLFAKFIEINLQNHKIRKNDQSLNGWLNEEFQAVQIETFHQLGGGDDKIRNNRADKLLDNRALRAELIAKLMDINVMKDARYIESSRVKILQADRAVYSPFRTIPIFFRINPLKATLITLGIVLAVAAFVVGVVFTGGALAGVGIAAASVTAAAASTGVVSVLFGSTLAMAISSGVVAVLGAVGAGLFGRMLSNLGHIRPQSPFRPLKEIMSEEDYKNLKPKNNKVRTVTSQMVGELSERFKQIKSYLGEERNDIFRNQGVEKGISNLRRTPNFEEYIKIQNKIIRCESALAAERDRKAAKGSTGNLNAALDNSLLPSESVVAGAKPSVPAQQASSVPIVIPTPIAAAVSINPNSSFSSGSVTSVDDGNPLPRSPSPSPSLGSKSGDERK